MIDLLSLNEAQWEALCDGCGRCCLVKLQDEDSDDVLYTNVACEYLDSDSCRCQVYGERTKRKPDCIKLTATDVKTLQIMPATCAYRRAWLEQEPIDNVADLSVRGLVISESAVAEDDLLDYVVEWVAVEDDNAY